MKTQTKKPFLNMDERNKLVAYKVIAIMYFLTIIAIQGIVIYRQFILGQEISDFEDIAVIMTVNSLFLISALLYFGAIPIRKLKVKSILAIYAFIVIAGSIFTYAKYNVFQSLNLPLKIILNKILIVAAVSGIIVIFFVLFSLLGKRRLEKDLGEE